MHLTWMIEEKGQMQACLQSMAEERNSESLKVKGKTGHSAQDLESMVVTLKSTIINDLQSRVGWNKARHMVG